MSWNAAILLALCITIEVSREIFFKLGAKEKSNAPTKNFMIYFRNLFINPYILTAFLLRALEITCWIVILEMVPLSIAFTVMSLCYCGILIASRFILKEKVSGQKWFGAILIAIGVALIGSAG